jgi:glutamate N-acetyltransferase/amino-acid N-acetyltransferase
VIRGRNLIRNTSGRLRGLLVNSGNANAATGEQGRKDCAASAQLVSEALKVHHSEFGAISPEAFITSSTGVIGVQLPMDKIGQGIDVCVKHLGSDAEDWMGAARGIMTTDTVPKVASTKVEMELKGEQMSCSIIGMAKGAGMIHPNMATLLVYFFTDAAISPSLLSKIFKPSIDDSFNSMTIDGDTSTNDTALIMASGDSNFKIEDSPGSNTPKSRFQNELTKLAIDLAHQVIRDQEGGCRTLCTIKVKGTPTDADAHKLARCVATSLLFRSALHGADPNWGRIAMAMGNAGVEFSISDVNMTLGEVKLMEAGQPLDFDEKTASDSLMSPDVTLAIEVGGGSGKGHYYCGDLSEDYITFNADYTT